MNVRAWAARAALFVGVGLSVATTPVPPDFQVAAGHLDGVTHVPNRARSTVFVGAELMCEGLRAGANQFRAELVAEAVAEEAEDGLDFVAALLGESGLHETSPSSDGPSVTAVASWSESGECVGDTCAVELRLRFEASETVDVAWELQVSSSRFPGEGPCRMTLVG